MSNLSMVEATLPPGFRFHPRDEELVCDYLMKKVSRCDHLQSPLLIEVDLNKCEPWDIPEMACVGGKEWYFYSQRDRKYATGLRTNRATNSGYWKATGKDRSVLRKRSLVGMRKTLVFYQGRAPKGKKTDWVMHEFRLEGPLGPPKPSSPKEDWVLCRVFCKNKEIGGKQGGGTSSSSSFHEDTSSSSLPPLMDPYGTISFNQTQPDPNQEYEQVPCFSIFTSPDNAPTSSFSHMNFLAPNLHMDPIVRPSAKVHASANLSNFGTIPVSPDLSAYLNQTTTQSISYEERKVIKAFVSHFNKMENVKESPSYGEGISDQSFLSDIGLPTMWYQG